MTQLSYTTDEVEPPLPLLLYLQSAPVDLIFSAFQADCAARGISWYGTTAQRTAAKLFLRHPACRKYPPRYATLRSLLKQYITLIEQPQITDKVLEEDTSNSDPIQLELMEAFIGMSIQEADKDHSMCFKTFYNPHADPLPDSGAHRDDDNEADWSPEERAVRERRCAERARALAHFCPVRVSSNQFSNVGLALWPAAFVTVQLLSQEMMGLSSLIAPRLFPNLSEEVLMNGLEIPERERISILELGAGVGLTPVLLHRTPFYKRCVSTFAATDYKEDIIDNIRYNFKRNRVTMVSDFVAAKRGLEGEKQPPYHLPALLDWSDEEANAGLLMELASDVILAADCIYDVSVIPSLVSTIRIALSIPHMKDALPVRSSSTREDDSTSAGSPVSASGAANRNRNGGEGGGGNGGGSCNSSSCGSDDGKRGGATTSGTGSSRKRMCIVVQTHRQDSTMKVFFDEIRRFAQVESYTLTQMFTKDLVAKVSRENCYGDTVPLFSYIPQLLRDEELFEADTPRMTYVLRPDVVLSDGSLRSAKEEAAAGEVPHNIGVRREKQMFTVDRHSPGELLELLQDEMIGPYYTSMIGLIGVHIIHMK